MTPIPHRPLPVRRLAAALVALGLCGAAPAPDAARAQTWIGASGASWSAAANWSPAGVPGPLGTATFSNGAGSATVLLTVNATQVGTIDYSTAQTITFQRTNTVAGLGFAALNVTGSAGAPVFTVPLTAASGGTTITLATGRSATFNGVFATLGNAITVDTAANALVDFAASSSLTGSGTLLKTGSGTLQLRQGNPTQHTGAIDVAGGALALGTASDLSEGGTTLRNGASLRLGVASGSGGSFGDLGGAFALGEGGGIIDTNGFNASRASAITGAGGLTKNGAGTLSLGARQSYTGATTVGAGVLELAPAFALVGPVTVNSGATVRLLRTDSLSAAVLTLNAGSALDTSAMTTGNTASLTVAALGGAQNIDLGSSRAFALNGAAGQDATYTGSLTAAALQMIGSNAQTLQGGTHQFAGGLSASGGTLTFSGGARTTVGGGSVVVSGNGSFGPTAALVVTGGGTRLTTGPAALNLGTTGGGELRVLSGGAVYADGGLFLAADTGLLGPSGVGVVTVDGAGSLLVVGEGGSAPTAQIGRRGNAALTVSGGGGVVFDIAGNSLQVGGFELGFPARGAVTVTGAGSLLRTVGSVNVGDRSSISGAGALRLGDGGTLSVGGDLNLNRASADGLSFVADGRGTSAGVARNLGVSFGSAAIRNGATVTAGGAVAVTDSATLTVSGAGSRLNAVSLSPISNGTIIAADGGTISAETLSMSMNQQGPLDPANLGLRADGGTIRAGTMNLDGGAERVLRITDRAGASADADTTALVIDGATTSTLAVRIEDGANGRGSITKRGAGTLILSRPFGATSATPSNTFSGATTVFAGTLIARDGLALRNSTLDLRGGTALFQDAGGNRLSAATLGGLRAASSDVSLALPGTLTVGGNGEDTTYAGTLTGTAGLIKVGAGTLRLTNTASTYTGATRVNGGVLEIADAGSLGVGAGAVALGGGTLRLAPGGGAEAVIGRLLSVGESTTSTIDTNGRDLRFTVLGDVIGELVKSGAGTLTLAGGINVEVGSLTLTGGTLRIAPPTAGFNFDIAGPVRLAGGTLDISTGGAEFVRGAVTLSASSTLAGSSPLILGGPLTIADTAALTIANNTTVRLDGSIGEANGAQALVKRGAGTLEVRGANNAHTLGTSVAAGTLRVVQGSNLGTGAVTVAQGATLALAGSVSLSNAVQMNGSLMLEGPPGGLTGGGSGLMVGPSSLTAASASSPTVTLGALRLGAGSLLAFDLASPTLLAITGELSGDAAGRFALALTGFEAAAPGTHTLAAFGATTLSASQFFTTGLPSGWNANVSLSAPTGARPGTLAVTLSRLDSAAAPEPGTLALVALGLAGAAARRRRTPRGCGERMSTCHSAAT